ncbi:MAG: thioredoxin domain-containing protein [Chitinophagaceae bacterium]|nr:thioredoxin domain-containing protein [Chitinophagaceae bacterium]
MANRLINEQSPYLLQHAHNPVDWYPWCDEAFEIAKREHKPVLVSIGYAACHWCHVMERESFEDPAIAAYMNDHFICIKVDREEHPDVDHMYMDAVQAISGSGGWPLNVFVTPDRAPFYGGTYFPPRQAYNRPSWGQLLQRMDQIWNEQQEEVANQAGQLLQHLRQASMRVTPAQTPLTRELCTQVAENLLGMADKEKGGFGAAPKFPGTMAISYLLEHYRYTSHQPSLDQALLSLDKMIEGGIYDQLGGGFARYSTDADWLAPHFEKMLYDNALLIMSLCDAYSVTGNARYKEVIEETIAFAERELTDGTGGYYSALDADSEGVEGKFYTWTWEDWIANSGDEKGVAAMYFGVVMEGNWEETNILHVATKLSSVAETFQTTEREVLRMVNEVKGRLLKARANRVRPLTDDKSLLAWNALMNIALSKASVALSNDEYKARAVEHAAWMLDKFALSDGRMLHTWKQGVAKITAKLDDYAYLIQALMQLLSLTGDEQYGLRAGELLNTVIAEFGREDGFFYYSPASQKDIPVRKVDLYDGAMPSGNAVMAHNLWLCGMCLDNSEWVERSEVMVRAMAVTASRYAHSFSYWAILAQRSVAGMKTRGGGARRGR